MSCGCKLRKSIIKNKLELDKRDVYLDYCATTKPDMDVIFYAEKLNRILWGNPSSQNTRGAYLYNEITNGSKKLIKTLNLNNYNYYFDTSSGEIAYKLSEHIPLDLITTSIDHNSLYSIAKQIIPVSENGTIDLAKLEDTINRESCILVYSPVNHETGSLQPVKDIFELCKMYKTPVILDAVQTINRLPYKQWIKYCNGFYISGHKINSIPGAAMLILDSSITHSFPITETLKFSMTRGSINSSAILALLYKANKNLLSQTEELNYISALDRDFKQILKGLKTEYHIETPENSTAGIINISTPQIDDMENFLFYLNNCGIYISRFSACTGDIKISSRILDNMYVPKERSLKSLRISYGKNSKRDDFYKLVNSINNFIRL